MSFSLHSAAPLTLEEIKNRARTASIDVQLVSRALAEAEASKRGQGIVFPVNPRIFADYRPLLIELPNQPTEPSEGYNIGIDGKVEISGAGNKRIEEIFARMEVLKEQLRLEQIKSMARAWQNAVSIELAQQRVEVVRQALELQQRLSNASQERVNVGVAAETEVITSTMELALIRTQFLEAERLLFVEKNKLRQLLDLPPDEEVVVRDLQIELQPVLGTQALVARALKTHPDLAMYKEQMNALETQDARLVREAFPELGYNIGLDAAPASPAFGYVGISLELPVLQRNQGPRSVVDAQKSSTQLKWQFVIRQIARDVSEAYNNYTVLKQQLKILEEEGVPMAQKNEFLLEEGWRRGRFELFRLMNATRELLRINRERIDALEKSWNAFIELERVSGGIQ